MEVASPDAEEAVIAQYQTTRIRQLWQNYQRLIVLSYMVLQL